MDISFILGLSESLSCLEFSVASLNFCLVCRVLIVSVKLLLFLLVLSLTLQFIELSSSLEIFLSYLMIGFVIQLIILLVFFVFLNSQLVISLIRFLVKLSLPLVLFNFQRVGILACLISVIDISNHLFKSYSIVSLVLGLGVRIVSCQALFSKSIVGVFSLLGNFSISNKIVFLDNVLRFAWNFSSLQSLLLSKLSLKIRKHGPWRDLDFHDFACFKPNTPTSENFFHLIFDSISEFTSVLENIIQCQISNSISDDGYCHCFKLTVR